MPVIDPPSINHPLHQPPHMPVIDPPSINHPLRAARIGGQTTNDKLN
jgi:hypothetical protein